MRQKNDYSRFLVKTLKLHNETIVLLQYFKCVRWSHESAEEWMGRLRVKGTECKCKEQDRRLKEHFKMALMIRL